MLHGQPATSQTWRYTEDTDPVTLRVTERAQVTWTDSLIENRGFIVRCSADSLEVYFSAGEFIGQSRGAGVTVTYRFDIDETPTSARWSISTSDTAIFAPGGYAAMSRILSGLTNGSVLFFRWTDYRGVQETTEVSLRGSSAAIARLSCASRFRGDGDYDDDGVANVDDSCPTGSEDLDGFEDGDGCPDLDNDSDGVADGNDQCPELAEDPDYFEDDDGCPDLDDDGDGVLDVDDNCRLSPNPSQDDSDGDGLGDACDRIVSGKPGVSSDTSASSFDADADGIPDDVDECPFDREDLDAYRDSDGCPDVDNDADGVLDINDNCRWIYNPLQEDDDADGFGNACALDFEIEIEPAPSDPQDDAEACFRSCLEERGGMITPRMRNNCATGCGYRRH